MADNVEITEGSGKLIATDEVVDGTLGTVNVQYVKLMDGTLNGTSKGAIDGNGLDVDVTRLPATAPTESTLAARLSESDFDTKVGALTETAPANDTASSGLNGRLQRIAQRLTSLLALLPAALTGSGNLKAALVESTATVSMTVKDSVGDSAMDDANNALRVNVVAGGASGTEYVEDAVSVADPSGSMLMARRRDSLAVETSATGDNTALNATGKGELYVKQTDVVPVNDNGGSLTVDGAVSITGAVDTELPAAAALADGAANPTTPRVGSPLEIFNGTTWDRARGDIANGLDVDVTRLPALPAGTNNIGDVDVLTLPAITGTVAVSNFPAAQPVTDNGGSLTVDGTVAVSGVVDVTPASPAANDYLPVRLTDGAAFYLAGGGGGGGDGAINDGVSNTIKATVLDYSASNPLAVRLTDTNGDYISASGAGTQYIEDDPAAANPTGSMLMGRRRDTLAAEVSADGDHVALNATNKGELYVKQVDVVPVNDNGGSLTVDGTVAVSNFPAAQPVTDNGGSLTIDSPQLPAALVSGRLDVAVGAALPAGTNNIGDVDVLTLPALPAGTNNIGDVDVLTLPAIPAGTNDMGKVRFSTPTTSALTEASLNAAAAGDNTLIAGTAAQTVRVFRLFLVCAGAVNIKFKDGAGTDLTAAMTMTASGAMVLDFSGEPWFITSASNGFVLNLSAAVQVSGRIYYTKS